MEKYDFFNFKPSIHVITTHTEDLWLKEWANIDVCISIAISCNQSWYKAT